MRIVFLLALLIASNLFAQPRSQEPLLRIVQNNRIGFIDLKGNVVIKPEYKEAGSLHDGLIPVRRNGTFGYIDRTGTMVIPDIYDYAEDFSNGFAIVYYHGDPRYIRTDGSRLRVFGLKKLEPFTDGLAIIVTSRNGYGIIDSEGVVVLDTIYNNITHNNAGRIGVNAEFYGDFLTLNFDTKKRKLLPSDKSFHLSSDFIQDSTLNYTYKGFDAYDKLRFTCHAAYDIHVNEGLMVVTRCISPGVDERGRSSFYRAIFSSTVMDTTGKVLIQSSPFSFISDFHDGIALAFKGDSVCLITPNGEIENVIRSIKAKKYPIHGSFNYKNGHYAVTVDSGRCIIDSIGNLIVAPIGSFSFSKNPDYIIRDQKKQDLFETINIFTGYRYSLPKNWSVNKYSTKDVLLLDSANTFQYLTYSGDFIYKWEDKNTSFSQLDICSKFANYRCYNFIDSIGDTVNQCDSRTARKAIKNPPKEISFVARSTDTIVSFHRFTPAESEKLFPIRILNGSNDSISIFEHTFIMEALNDSNSWVEIETVSMGGWCGTGFKQYKAQQEVIPPKTALFCGRIFHEGSKKVKLRIKVDIKKNMHSDDITTIYTNEFDGVINPAQFWRNEAELTLWGDSMW